MLMFTSVFLRNEIKDKNVLCNSSTRFQAQFGHSEELDSRLFGLKGVKFNPKHIVFYSINKAEPANFDQAVSKEFRPKSNALYEAHLYRFFGKLIKFNSV